jgi:two-component sensor histidine kinase
MKDWLCGKRTGLVGFVLIATLVAGGLGWATAAVLRLESEQLAQRAEAERGNRLRLALWRLDSRISPLLAREDSRPFNHYSAISPVPVALNNSGACWPAGTVMEPSPLLSAELPAWMRLHFQTDPAAGWKSPQVLSPRMTQLLRNRRPLSLTNVTPERQALLSQLAGDLPADNLLALAREHTQPPSVRDTTLRLAQQSLDNPANPANAQPTLQVQQALQQNPEANFVAPYQNAFPGNVSQEYGVRRDVQSKVQNEARAPQRYQKDVALNTVKDNGMNWLSGPKAPPAVGAEVVVQLSPMVPLWLQTRGGREHLVLFRLVHIEETETCQGIVLDAAALEEMLAHEVEDLFPDARLMPMRDPEPAQPERTMTALPLQLDVGPHAPVESDPGWTPLRVGLALAWLAALVALLAVGLGGWSLLDLSERRIRFVSAVTHELRTPLTTLRLYLDMLHSGMVREEKQRQEYIETLHGETDRLNRLVGNVLAFSRLENQRPQVNRTPVVLSELLEHLRADWSGHCQNVEKELLLENALGPETVVCTDGELLQHVLGNLIDNACKYSRGAEDRRLWVRVLESGRHLRFEVEDCGPGVPANERRTIFRAFRRGRSSDVTAGGVGLGLALARRWVRLLGGRLTLVSNPSHGGACFRVELPSTARMGAGK